MQKIAVYPGSFDPVTNGHLDVLERASWLFSHIVMAVVVNPSKEPLISLEERMELLRKAVHDVPNVEIDSFSGLLIDYVRQKNSSIVIRGLRALSDFEYEFQMAHINKKLGPDIETVFIAADNRYTFISSRTIKEIFSVGGDISSMVPPVVEQAYRSGVFGNSRG